LSLGGSQDFVSPFLANFCAGIARSLAKPACLPATCVHLHADCESHSLHGVRPPRWSNAALVGTLFWESSDLFWGRLSCN